jgi:hypothetical protein
MNEITTTAGATRIVFPAAAGKSTGITVII